MATTANVTPGAVAAAVAAATNGSADPFTASPTSSSSHAHPPAAALRYAAFDKDDFSSAYATQSPAAAKRALEAHLKDTDRRIQDASRLGSTLVQQRKDLAARLQEVELVPHEHEVPGDLRRKLRELEREYNELGRESARAFLPKSRVVSDITSLESAGNAALLSAQARESPTKVSAPSRRQRNQPSNRVHDIEFATEISTSLLAQVRQLQAALAEKDEALKETTASKAQIETETMALLQRIRHMDESEQKYKDENWNLEMKLQELEASFKESSDKESRLTQSLKAIQVEKAAKERELDELKLAHDRAIDDHTMSRKVQEADLHGLRRDAAHHDAEKERLQSRIAELTAQNTELAKAISYRLGHPAKESDTDFLTADEALDSHDDAGEHSDPASPVKGTPARHGMLESETLKSSLSHAHRMIQNLKNNIHREKTEKIELKRMLQDARDELETRRDSSASSSTASLLAAKKRREQQEALRKRPSQRRLGAARTGTTEILGDAEPDWEEIDGERTPSKSRTLAMAAGGGMALGAGAVAAAAAADYSTSTETDAFETADERNETTESEAFATGAEDFDDDTTEGELTETEDRGGVAPPLRSNTIRGVSGSASSSGILPLRQRADRRSISSTASLTASEDDDDDNTAVLKTPVQTSSHPKYKVRVNRLSKRASRAENLAAAGSPVTHSPAGSVGFGTPQAANGNMQSLEDELSALSDDEDVGSLQGTPVVLGRTLEEELPEGSTPGTVRSGVDEDEEETASMPPTTPLRSSSVVGGATPSTVRSGIVGGDASPLAGKAQQLPAAAAAAAAAAVAVPSVMISKPAMVDAGIMTEPWEPSPAAVPGPAAAAMVPAPAASEEEQKPKLLDRAEGVIGGALAGLGLGSVLGRQSQKSDNTKDDAPKEAVAAAAEAKPATEASPSVAAPPPPTKKIEFSFSEIVALEITPIEPPPVVVVDNDRIFLSPTPPEVSRPPTAKTVVNSGTDAEESPFANFGARGQGDKKVPEVPVIPAVVLGSDAASDKEKGLAAPATSRDPLGDISPNVTQRKSAVPVKKPVADEGSQTLISAQEIESMLNGSKPADVVPTIAVRDAGVSPMTPPRTVQPSSAAFTAAGLTAAAATAAAAAGASVRRPTSAGSTRSKSSVSQPPLPADHNQKIAAAAQTGSAAPITGSMGPPLMPASAYKSARPRTPSEKPVEARDGTTPRPGRGKDSRGGTSAAAAAAAAASPSGRTSHRGSVSSFASELDDRFNISRGAIAYPHDIEPSTDPRMIQAITQTMIGEYLWKYTRKAGRSETSNTRHRRFFWVHPYTRTLYWSEHDPSTAGKHMLKAKSVAIDAVRVVTDDNVFPPGLHRKSLVVVTPGREIVFTAPSGQRHETWFNALSYLLLKTEQEKDEADDVLVEDDGEGDDLRPGFGRTVRRSFSKMTGTNNNHARSLSRHSTNRRASLSSYHSRTTRTSSPQRAEAVANLVARPAAATQTAKHASTTPAAAGKSSTTTSRYGQNPRESSGSVTGRFSSLASRFRPPSRGRTSGERARGSGAAAGGPVDPAQIYDAHVAESAEDVRTQLEQQERNADLLENVRACCDGESFFFCFGRTTRLVLSDCFLFC